MQPPSNTSEMANPRNIFSTSLIQGDLVSSSSPVTETLILRNGTIVPDNYAPMNQDSSNQLDYPTAVIYVSNSHHLYVTGGVSLTTYQSSNKVVVLDGDTNRVTTELNVTSPAGLAYDPLNNNIYVASTAGLTVISDSSLSVVATISLDPGTSGVAYNPVNNQIYVSNYSKSILYVINPSTNHFTRLAVATGPTGIVYDPDNKRLYVNCVDAGTVFEINATDNRLIANVTVNPAPTKLSQLIPPLGNAIPQVPTQNIVYDSSSHRIYLMSKITEGIVSILDTSTNKVAGTVTLGPHFAFGLAYDSSRQNVYATNYASSGQSHGMTSIINATTNKIAANVTVGLGPTGIVYDPQNGNMYVACTRSDTVSIIHGATNKSNIFLGFQDFPTGVAYDPANHLIYVADASSYITAFVKDSISGSSNLLAVNTTTGKVQQI